MFEVIQLGPFMFWTHAFFFLLAVWLSLEFFLRLAETAHLSIQHFKDRALHYLVAFLLGGRIIAIIAQYRVYLRDPLRIIMVHDGNFSFLGAAIGIGILLYVVTRGSRTTFLHWLDVIVPAATFGLFFDWVGKFAAGQEYGRPTDMFWGVTYDAINVRYTVPVHPVQLYYALFYLLLTFGLLIVRKYTARAGWETLVGIVLASLATISFESFRGDFSIPVFATNLDFVLLFLLFAGLGILALIELKLTERQQLLYEVGMFLLFGGYFLLRPLLPLPTHELRFNQLLSVLALFAVVVYVVVHRRRYPHL